MVRVIGNFEGVSEPDINGPLLLLHDLYNDGMSWMNRSDQTPAAIPVRLYQEGGFDVYIGNKRGTAPSRTHETLDADADADYWNWSIDEVGANDIPAMISKIQMLRAEEGLPAQKVTVITNSVSSAEALITLS